MYNYKYLNKIIYYIFAVSKKDKNNFIPVNYGNTRHKTPSYFIGNTNELRTDA